MLPSYALEKYTDIDVCIAGVSLENLLLEAISSTKVGFPNDDLLVFIDKKSVKSQLREKLVRVLEKNAIDWTFEVNFIKSKLSEY